MRWLRFAGGCWDRKVASVFSGKLSFLLTIFWPWDGEKLVGELMSVARKTEIMSATT